MFGASGLEKKIICVTGASGFIGSHLLSALSRRQDITIRVMQRSQKAEVHDGCSVYVGDLFDEKSLAPFLQGAHCIINLAQPSGSVSDEQFADAMSNIARVSCAANVNRFLHISTAMVVGAPSTSQVDESTVCRPVTAYERQKLMAEDVLIQELSGKVDLGILRPTAVFGAGGKNLLKIAGVIAQAPRWRRSLLRFVHGRRRMHLVSVDDVIAAILFLMDIDRPLDRNVFLISADDEPRNHYQAVDAIIGNVMGKPIPRSYLCMPSALLRMLLAVAGRSQSNPQLRYDSSKLMSWGFRRKANFERSLEAFARGFIAKGVER